jgi:hypothetical protein
VKDNEKVFDDIIRNRRWSDHPCGTGSLMSSTEKLREELPRVIAELECQSMLDAPCGDYSWMSQITWPEGFQYIGSDIVSDMITRLQEQWPERDFRHMDIINDPLPQVDIMLCRDCLIHFPWADIRRTVENVVRSGIRYLATTSYPRGENHDISMGHCHHINLLAEPACFPEPLYAILDQGVQTREHYIMIWSREQLQTALELWR